jgi:brefeldin A-resistance guanine nucleotide exchange factor 1
MSGVNIAKFPSLRQLVVDTGCKYLFQLARSDNPTVLSLALRTIATIFETMRPHLKLQQELLLSFLIDKLTPPPGGGTNGGAGGRTQLGLPHGSRPNASSAASTSDLAEREKEKDETDEASRPPSRTGKGVTPAKGETRELMLETLGHLSRYPLFMVDVWVNYDCDIDCEDVFERLIGFLAKVCIMSCHNWIYAEYFIERPASRSTTKECTDLVSRSFAHLCEQHGRSH